MANVESEAAVSVRRPQRILLAVVSALRTAHTTLKKMSRITAHQRARVASVLVFSLVHLRARGSERCGETAPCRARAPGTIRARDKLLV